MGVEMPWFPDFANGLRRVHTSQSSGRLGPGLFRLTGAGPGHRTPEMTLEQWGRCHSAEKMALGSEEHEQRRGDRQPAGTEYSRPAQPAGHENGQGAERRTVRHDNHDQAAAIYLRISKHSAKLGLGVDRQEFECRHLVERLGWEVGRVYCDNDISAFGGKHRIGWLQHHR